MIKLKQISGAESEQYEAYLNGDLVGYLRLHRGQFGVQCPDIGGVQVYSTSEVEGYNAFEAQERDVQLCFAVNAIQNWISGNTAGSRESIMIPNVVYSIS